MELQELVAVCRAAETDKVTERKKQTDKLQQLLGKAYIVKALDKASDMKAANPRKTQTFAWDTLFKVAKSLVLREGESLRKAKEALTSTAQSNREKKKQDVAQIFKMIVRLADKRGQRLKGLDVVQHVVEILDDPFLCSVFGPDHSSVLLKDILSVHKYWCELTFKIWHELIGRYCGLLKEPHGNFDRVVLARVVYMSVTGAAQQCDLRGRKLTPLLEEYFKTIKQERSMAVVEHMVSAVNALSRAIAVDGRVQLCRLGENIFVMLIYLWRHRPTERLKDEMVEFFQLQLNIHHPLGARSEEQGAFAVDSDLWKRNMKTLYEVVYSELEEMGERHKFATGSRDVSQGQLKESFVSMAADLCYQLFSDHVAAVEVTQMSFLQTQPGSAAKKRRVESGWAILRDHMTNHGHTRQGLAWVQLLKSLVSRYPTAVPEDEFIHLQGALAHAQAECRTLLVLQWLLRCLEVFAQSQHQSNNSMSEIGRQACGDTWQKVWASVLRSISFHHAVDEGFQLLRVLIEHHLVVPNRDLWTLFLPCLCLPSSAAVHFLSVFLQHHDLPETYRPSVLVAMATESGEGYPLRCQLVDWALPDQEEMSEGGTTTSSIEEIDPKLMAETLVSLTLRNSSSIKTWHSPNCHPVVRPYRQIENIYLQTCFEQALFADTDAFPEALPCTDVGRVTGSRVDCVEKRLEAALITEARRLLALSQPETAGVESMVQHCSLLLQVLCSQLEHGVYDLQQLSHSQLCNSFKDLMKRVSSCIADLIQKGGAAGISSCTPMLTALFDVGDCSSTTSQQVAALLRSLTPAKLIDQLLQVISEKPKPNRTSVAVEADLSFAGTPSRTSAFDELDLEMDFNDTGLNTGIFEEDDVSASWMDSQDSELLESGSGAVFEGLLSDRALTDIQLTKLAAVRALCIWCKHETDSTYPGLPSGGSHVSCSVVKEKLLDLLDEDRSSWDPTRAYDLQLMKAVVEGLASPQHLVHDQDLESMLEAVRLVCKHHRRDQLICHFTLGLIRLLVPHLASPNDDAMVTESRRESRNILLHLLSVFWKLSLGDQYTHPARLAVARCMLEFLKVDPGSEWTVWKMKGDGDGNESRSLREEFPRLLLDKHQHVRLTMAAAVGRLFCCGGEEELERGRQDEMFANIYHLFQDVMTIEGRYSADEQNDEAVNRTSSLLHTLAAIACGSAVCEKKAVFAALQMVQENNFDVDLVKKVLRQLGSRLSAEGLPDFMGAHLPYLVDQWLDSGYKLQDFPVRLLGYSRLHDFYSCHYKVVIPFLVMRQDLDGVKELCNVMSRDWMVTISESLPSILIHILPLFAASKNEDLGRVENVRKQVKHTTACYRLLTEALSEQLIEQSIVSHLEEIVVGLLQTLYDVRDTASAGLDYTRNTEPEPNPPHFNTKTIRATLDYLTNCHTTKVKSLVALLAKSQDGIQRVLLSLRTHLSQSQRPHVRRQGLRMYRLFVRLLLDEFHLQLGGSWAYVLRNVLFTLIHTIQQQDHKKRSRWTRCEVDVACMCFDLLKSVSCVAVQHCPEELSRFLSAVVSCVIPYVECEAPVGTQSTQLLQFLVVENATTLQDSLRLLDPFPPGTAFDAARTVQHKYKYAQGDFSLYEEVSHFLKVRWSHLADSAARGGLSHLSGLQFLHQQLSTRKTELAKLLEECEDRQSEALLVQLVYEFIELSKCGNEEVAQAAGRCLGEVGPADLSVVALRPRQHSKALAAALNVYQGDCLMQRNCRIFHILDQLLLDESVKVVTSAGQVLKQLLATRSGISFYTDYKSNVTDHLFQYLHPFKAAKKKPVAPSYPDTSEERFQGLIADNLVWTPRHNDHGRWVMRLASVLIESGGVQDELLVLLKPLCDVKVEFCEAILPFLIHDVLLQTGAIYREVLSTQISSFFALHCEITDQVASRPATPMVNTGEEECSVLMNPASVRVLLSVVQYLRLQELPPAGRVKTTPWDQNFWLDLDYLQVAKAAQNCQDYFSTLLYAEIWCYQNRGQQEAKLSQASQQSLPELQFSASSQLENLAGRSSVNVQSLLLEASRCLGDPDGVYGCGAGKLADPTSRINTYEHEDNWAKAVASRDLQLGGGATSSSAQVGLLQALQNFGARHVLDRYLQGLTMEGQDQVADIQEFQFQSAWRNCHWTLDTPTRFDGNHGYHCTLYGGLRAMKDGDVAMAAEALRCSRLSVLRVLGEASVESCRSLYPALAQLLCVTQGEDAAIALRGESSLTSLLERWQHQDCVLCNDFDFVEPVLHQRCVILHLLQGRIKNKSSDIHAALTRHLESAARTAREAGRHQVGERYIHWLAGLELPGDVGGWSWRVEEARMFWCRGEHNIAKHLMKNLISKLEKLQNEDLSASALYPKCLGIYGNWLAETRSENPSIVMENYLKKAVVLLEDLDSDDDAALDAFLSLARFADSQYQNISTYMKSSTFEAKQALARKAKSDAEQLKLMGEKNSRYQRTLEKQSTLDEEELAAMTADCDKFLHIALVHYLKCLQRGDKHDMRVFRLTSLWFENATQQKVNEQMKSGVQLIKPHKFLPLMYQLAARMSQTTAHDGALFQTTLDKLIERTVLAHPHHTLNIILALAHANKDLELVQRRQSKKASGRLSRGGASNDMDTDEDRVRAAKSMIGRLKQSRCAPIVVDMERLCEAYIILANWSVDQYKKETKPIKLPDSQPLIHMKGLKNVAVPTLEIPVDPTGAYENIVYVQEFKPTFKLAGGINLPKIISCVGSDGQARRQLVKGRDDLRQDAVMQQVFGLVNNLLHKDPETRKRKLTVRTYKVIPLSQRSGLLEWCEGTVPLGEYLISGSGAHVRYRPNDMRAYACRIELQKGHEGKSGKSKYEAFMYVCERMQPVFRHFFLEKFPEPADWYEKRLAYTRSVATNSIVGYILGLGDRHVQNILIDCQTAELVHIDLGVAFEQGRILPTPETVPFRLTRDIVDGMGVVGVEGVFRRCCEKTMEVMHQSQEALLTILQVLLYDPLYAWTISPLKAYALQQHRDKTDTDNTDINATGTGDILDMAESTNNNEPKENVNKVAERVLLRLQQKLQGLEDGVQLSVSGQVNHLIQEARDPNNLCRVFSGWQPYI